MAQWLWRRLYFHYIYNYFPLKNGLTLHLKKQLVIPFTHRKLCNQFAWINTVVLERKNFNGQKCIIIFPLNHLSLNTAHREKNSLNTSIICTYEHWYTTNHLLYGPRTSMWTLRGLLNYHTCVIAHKCGEISHTCFIGAGLWSRFVGDGRLHIVYRLVCVVGRPWEMLQ